MKLKLETRQDKQVEREHMEAASVQFNSASVETSSKKLTKRADPISLVSFSRRTYFRLFASVAILSLWLLLCIKGWAAYGEFVKQHEAEEQKTASKIAALQMLETKFGDPHVAAASRDVVKNDKPNKDATTAELMREVFLNPGLFLLFGGIVVGFISCLQGNNVTAQDDQFFVVLFHGILCLFLLEIEMTAAKRLAVPAMQRIAIPEASPTLPLAASLGLTFSYNVSLGIPIYLAVAEHLLRTYPVV